MQGKSNLGQYGSPDNGTLQGGLVGTSPSSQDVQSTTPYHAALLQKPSEASVSDLKHAQSQLLLRGKMTPLQTPSNRTGGEGNNSQSQTTDPAEIYDSVHSLSHGIHDGSLNGAVLASKKLAHLQALQDQLYGTEEAVDDEGQIQDGDGSDDSSEVTDQNNEETSRDIGHMSALQSMLAQSELFIKKQTSTAQSTGPGAEAVYTAGSSALEQQNVQNTDLYGTEVQQNVPFDLHASRLPEVQACDSSSRQDGSQEDSDFELVRRDQEDASMGEGGDDSPAYEPSESIISSSEQSVTQRNPESAEEMKTNDQSQADPVSPVDLDRQAKAQEIEAVYADYLLACAQGKKGGVPEVVDEEASSNNEPSFLTVIKDKSASFQADEGHGQNSPEKEQNYLLNDTSGEATPQMHPHHQITTFNSSIASSTTSPVVVTSKHLPSTKYIDQAPPVNPRKRRSNALPSASTATKLLKGASNLGNQPIAAGTGVIHTSNPSQFERQSSQREGRTQTPSLTSFQAPSLEENYESVRLVYEHAQDRMNYQEVRGAGELVFGETETEGDEGTAMSSRRTLRQSVDQNSHQVLHPSGASQRDSLEFQTGPVEVASCRSSTNSSNIEVSAVAASPDLQGSLVVDCQNNLDQHRIETLSPVPSGEEIRVHHFAKTDQMDSLVELDDFDKSLQGNKQKGSRSEAKNSLTNGLQMVGLAQMHPSSLSNSLKKSVASSQQQTTNSEVKTRSFSDVLNAMRDTEDIEREKRKLTRSQLLDQREISPFEGQGAADLGQGSDRNLLDEESLPEEVCLGEQPQLSFLTDGSSFNKILSRFEPSQANHVMPKTTNTFKPVARSRQQKMPHGRNLNGQSHLWQMELYSDSLNAKSEDKKNSSNSIKEEDKQTLPSFYKVDVTSSCSTDNENNLQRPSGEAAHESEGQSRFNKVSSFASGAQAQIAYTDQVEQQQAKVPQQMSANQGHQHHGRVANQMGSHYRGESFGNCLPLASAATSSQRDSTSFDGHPGGMTNSPVKLSAKKMRSSRTRKSLESAVGSMEYQEEPRIRETEDEESDRGSSSAYDRSEVRPERGNSDILADSGAGPDEESSESRQYSQEETEVEISQNLTRELSKIDSLANLRQFFSRDKSQIRCRTDEDERVGTPLMGSDDLNNGAVRLVTDISQERNAQQIRIVSTGDDVISEENVIDEQSPERAQQQQSLTQNGRESDHQHQSFWEGDFQGPVKIDLVTRQGKKGRESERQPAVSVLYEEKQMQKRASLQESNHQIKILSNSTISPPVEPGSGHSISLINDSGEIGQNGPPQSINMSDYSLLKNLVDKALKSPKQESLEPLSEAMALEVQHLQGQNVQYRDKVAKLQAQLRLAETRNLELETSKNRAVARAEMLESQSQIASEQLANEQKNAQHFKAKYRELKHEFQKMKFTYQTELTSCVNEMEGLRVIVMDVVSQQSETTPRTKTPPLIRPQTASNALAQSPATPAQAVRSSTGEPNLVAESESQPQTHVQSARVIGTRNALAKLSQRGSKAAPKEETTSSESPVRGLLVKRHMVKRSGRFSSHEQFSIGSSQALTAHFSGDFSRNKEADSASEYGGDLANSSTKRLRAKLQRLPFESNSTSSFKGTSTGLLLINKIACSNDSKSTSTHKQGRRARQTSLEDSPIPEQKEEDYASVFASNRRTLDLMKSAMQTGKVFQQAQRQARAKQAQGLQNMLEGLYQKARTGNSKQKYIAVGNSSASPVARVLRRPRQPEVNQTQAESRHQTKSLLMNRPR